MGGLTGEETIASSCFFYFFVDICFSFIFIFVLVVEIIFVAIEIVWQLIAAGRL